MALLGAILLSVVVSGQASADPQSPGKGGGAGGAADYWTPDRVRAAVPRDLVVDHRGLGYLRHPDGSLTPHGHAVPAEHGPVQAEPARSPNPSPTGGPGPSDTTPPTIGAVDPAAGATIGSSHVFSAVVTDASGVRSVTFVITYPDGTRTSSFSASRNGDTWTASLQGFTDGEWSWHVVAKDAAKRGGNTATSPPVPFTVDTTSGGGGGGGGGGSDIDAIASAEWTHAGAVQNAAGRLYFEMPANPKLTRWQGYVCSGTVATDASTGRSVIITAAHCVYDDVYKTFARNVLFVPNQAGTTGTGTDLNCSNDPLGCWSPSFGVVDEQWTAAIFPDNIPWDYAYYVVADSGAHSGTGSDGALDAAAGSLSVQFTAPVTGDTTEARTHALGYSYNEDPKFMYCAEKMGTEGADNWWLPSCLLSGGSSGGPWVQPMDESTGSGPIISVNSWGYSNSAGMAGPKLSGTSASCLFTEAEAASFASVTGRGVVPPAC